MILTFGKSQAISTPEVMLVFMARVVYGSDAMVMQKVLLSWAVYVTLWTYLSEGETMKSRWLEQNPGSILGCMQGQIGSLTLSSKRRQFLVWP